MLQRISRSNDEKYPKSCIDPQDHLFVLGLIRIPPPSGRPPSHHEGVNTNEENQAKEYQCHAEKAQSCREIHVSPPVFWDPETEYGGNIRRRTRLMSIAADVLAIVSE